MGGERLVNDIGFGLFRNRLDCFGAQPEPPADPQGCFSMQSTVVKRSVIVGSHKTSVSLEDAFWSSLRDIAAIAARLSRTSPGCSANVGFCAGFWTPATTRLSARSADRRPKSAKARSRGKLGAGWAA